MDRCENVGHIDQGTLNHYHLQYACHTQNFIRLPLPLRAVGTISIEKTELLGILEDEKKLVNSLRIGV